MPSPFLLPAQDLRSQNVSTSEYWLDMSELWLEDKSRFLIFAYPMMAFQEQPEKDFCFSIRASSVYFTWSPVIVGWFVRLQVQEKAGVEGAKWAKLLGKN